MILYIIQHDFCDDENYSYSVPPCDIYLSGIRFLTENAMSPRVVHKV